MDKGRPLFELLEQIKRDACEYYAITGRPLGVTGEVAEYEAAKLLGLELASVRQAGHDAIRTADQRRELIQIKGRCLQQGLSKGRRVSRIDVEAEWDILMLVLLDERLEPTAIYETDRASVLAELAAPGSRARNERHTLSVAKLTKIGVCVWPKQEQ